MAAVPTVLEDDMTAVGIDMLPDHVLIEIFSYLPLMDVVRGACVCRTWHFILKHKKSLWRQRKYCCNLLLNRDEVEMIAMAMPQLRCLHIVTAMENVLHVAWPEAALCLKCDSSGRMLQKLPYFVKFHAECLVIDTYAFPIGLSWVRCQTLKTICMADPCFIARNNTLTPFYFGDVPNRSISCDPKMFCGFCTYNHHRTCTGPTCPLKWPVNQLAHLWCQPDTTLCSTAGSARSRSNGNVRNTATGAGMRGSARKSLQLPALEEANLLCSFMTLDRVEHLCAISRPVVLHIRCRLFDFSFLRHCRSSLEELNITRCPVLPGFTELRQLKKLKVLRMSHYHGLKPCLKYFFSKQRFPQKASFNSSESLLQ